MYIMLTTQAFILIGVLLLLVIGSLLVYRWFRDDKPKNQTDEPYGRFMTSKDNDDRNDYVLNHDPASGITWDATDKWGVPFEMEDHHPYHIYERNLHERVFS